MISTLKAGLLPTARPGDLPNPKPPSPSLAPARWSGCWPRQASSPTPTRSSPTSPSGSISSTESPTCSLSSPTRTVRPPALPRGTGRGAHDLMDMGRVGIWLDLSAPILHSHTRAARPSSCHHPLTQGRGVGTYPPGATGTQLMAHHRPRMELLYTEFLAVLQGPHADAFAMMPDNFHQVNAHRLPRPPLLRSFLWDCKRCERALVDGKGGAR